MIISPRCRDCGSEPGTRGLIRERCGPCYDNHRRALQKAGTFASRNVPKTAIDRLADNSRRDRSGCVIWTGPLCRGGYGKTRYEGRTRTAHSLSYETLVGPVPAGMQLDHLCHTRDSSCDGGACIHRQCINPDHLEPVTSKENNRRSPLGVAGANFRKTHCISGHPFDAANTYLTRTGSRKCRACRREASDRYRASQRNRPAHN